MKTCHRVTVALMLAVAPIHLGAQQVVTQPVKPVRFVCEHGTVKSVLAKVLFEQYAAEVGLKMQAVSRGTRADSTVTFPLRRRPALVRRGSAGTVCRQ